MDSELGKRGSRYSPNERDALGMPRDLVTVTSRTPLFLIIYGRDADAKSRLLADLLKYIWRGFARIPVNSTISGA